MSLVLRRHQNLLLTYLRPQRRSVILLATLLLCNIGLQLVSPQVLGSFIDRAQRGGADDALTAAALLFIGLSLAQRLVALAAVYVGENVGWSATNRLRADLARHVLRLDMPFHKSHTPGELIERIDGDVTALANYFSRFAINILGNGLLIAGILALLFRADWRVGTGLTLYTLLTFLVMRAFQSMTVRRYTQSRQASAEQYGFIEERISGTEDIRASGAEGYVMHRLYRLMRARLEKQRSSDVTSQSMFFATSFLYVLGYAAGLGLGAWLYTQGEASIGTAYIIVFYIGMLNNPVVNIRQEVQDLQQASASIGRVDLLLNLPSALREQPRAQLPGGPLAAELDRVSFRYEEGEKVLDDVSLRIEAGRVLGLLGRTGSGKTTITRLLVRLYDPQQGSVRVGGLDLREVGFADLRRHVGMVTQDVQLFKATVRDNLTFFDPRIPDERIEEVLEELGLGGWLRQLPNGLHTVLAGGGGGLSAGEAQLLAFARVFLKDPGLVILDEASSRLDPVTERLVEQAVDRLFVGRTGLVIAHRLKTVQRAGDILILEEGRVAEYGCREDLASHPDSRFCALLRTGMEEVLV